MQPRVRVLASVLLLASSCATDDAVGDGGGAADGGVTIDPSRARVWPPIAHTGYDGSTEFRVPVSTDLALPGAGPPTWSTDDPGIVDIVAVSAPDDVPLRGGAWAMVTARSPGSASISAALGGYTVSSEVLVAAYGSAQIAAGDARYHDASGTDDRVACASCHLQADGADHTPTEMAFHDDAALLVVITEGHYPDLCIDDQGNECSCGSEGCRVEPGYVLPLSHSWNLTGEEADGIVPYLRSLPPRGF